MCFRDVMTHTSTQTCVMENLRKKTGVEVEKVDSCADGLLININSAYLEMLTDLFRWHS